MSTEDLLGALAGAVDEYNAHYSQLRGASDLRGYLAAKADRADEEIVTEPILRLVLERVLGFPKSAFFEQLGKGGKKPDFTPFDLIAHPFVLDAKSSSEQLTSHETQIRGYMTQRDLDFGVLFNLRELRVYRRGEPGHDPKLSFGILPLWEQRAGEALPGAEFEAFVRFCSTFSHRKLALDEKIEQIGGRESWSARLLRGDAPEIDVEFLVKGLRTLSLTIADDARAQHDVLQQWLGLHPARERKLLEELELLALDISPGAKVDELPKTIEAWRTEAGLPERVWRQYLVRVAYLALTRILLYRAWEDVQFVDEYLYDGGFDAWYRRLEHDVRRVLNEAFLHGQQQYPWLYGRENNYDWYRPRAAALVDVLYGLAPFPLGRLDADVLGALYESYVDDIDRDRLGQFFTPRSVVKFMLDRAGFDGPDGVFRIEGNKRKPLHVLDFATGSGGFLVEAARRVIDGGGLDRSDPRALTEGLTAVVRGFVGAEISPFPYYLTEVNLLLQVSRLLGDLRAAGAPLASFPALGVLHVDTLTAKSAPNRSLDQLDPKLRGDRAELVADERFDLVPLDGDKFEAYRSRLAPDGGFDLVIGNPPYVTEANNKPLFDRLRAIQAWKGIYRGKTDYLYYFLWLAVEKLKPGGRLCVITPAGWMNAGAADFLREKLAADLRLDELYLFGSNRLFATEGSAPTPTVESAILVATKDEVPDRHALRVVALEEETDLDREMLLAEMARRAAGSVGRRAGIHVHDVLQTTLRADRPWPIKHTGEDIPSRVVAHLEAQLGNESIFVDPLTREWKVFLGIQTGADTYSPKVRRLLPDDVREGLEETGAQPGDPIYALPPGTEGAPPWALHPRSLVKSPEPEAVLYGALDEESYVNLVWLTRADPPPSVILDLLARWRPLLARRAEFVRNPRRQWWETCWPRSSDDLAKAKVIALHRTDRGRFALDEGGDWSPSGRMSVVIGRTEGAPVAYLCGLLNSELLDLWYSVRGRVPRDIWRDYEPKPMGAIPYRRPDDDPRADRVADLVRAIAANRRALLPHRAVIKELGRTVKDPWRPGPVEVNRAVLIHELDPADAVSVRLDTNLEVLGAPSGKHSRPDDTTFVFRRARAETGRVTGEVSRIDLLAEILPASVDTVDDVLLPKALDAFARLCEVRASLVRDLLAEGRRLVEEVERLVCALYELPDDLTDEVVAHAVARASRGVSE